MSVVTPDPIPEVSVVADEGVTQDRATHLHWPDLVQLNRFGCYIFDAWGHHAYLVGSALYRSDYRDVDVRLILPDDEYEQRFGPIARPRYENACWNAHCLAWTRFGMAMTGLLIDFQIDQQTYANRLHQSRRHPLGISGWGPAMTDRPVPEALVEAGARALFAQSFLQTRRKWSELSRETRNDYRADARTALEAARAVRTPEGNSALLEWVGEWVGDAFAEPGTAQAFSEEQISVGRKDSRDD